MVEVYEEAELDQIVVGNDGGYKGHARLDDAKRAVHQLWTRRKRERRRNRKELLAYKSTEGKACPWLF